MTVKRLAILLALLVGCKKVEASKPTLEDQKRFIALMESNDIPEDSTPEQIRQRLAQIISNLENAARIPYFEESGKQRELEIAFREALDSLHKIQKSDFTKETRSEIFLSCQKCHDRFKEK